MIGELAQQGYGQRLASEHPFLEAEVVYCATNGKQSYTIIRQPIIC
jgi:hypothetical protein